MVNYNDLSIGDLSKKWDDICLNISQLYYEVFERINDDTSRSDDETFELEALYEEIGDVIDFGHIEDITSYISNEKS